MTDPAHTGAENSYNIGYYFAISDFFVNFAE